MSTPLHDRLADLATDAPPGGAPPSDLWDRGRRYQRRRRAGNVVIAAVVVVLLGVLGTLGWQQPDREPLPAGPVGGGGLPDRFFDPDPDLPTTGEEGPLGRLAAVVGSESGDLVGISWETGEYRRLELPTWTWDDVPLGASEVALSADGRRIGYWYVEDGRAVGIGVYDAVTDETTRHEIASEFGLMPGGMAWVGDRLWFDAPLLEDDSGMSASGTTDYLWSADTGELSEVSLARSPGWTGGSALADGVFEAVSRKVVLYSPDAKPVRWTVDVPVTGPVVASPGGVRLASGLAAGADATSEGRGVAVLTPGGGGRLTGQEIPGLRVDHLVAWRGQQHVVVQTEGVEGYQSVDIATGEAETLTVPGPSWAPGLHVAQDAWSAPTYAATAPPAPAGADPWPGIAAVAVVLLGGLALLVWRRRVRP